MKPGIPATLGIACALAVTSTRIHAQEAEGNRPTARFTVWGDWTGKDLFVEKPGSSSDREDRYLKLDLLDLGYSGEIPFDRAKPIALCVQTEKDGETLWQPLIQVSVPGDVREPLVMIFPGDDEKTRCKVFDLDPSTFPYGSYQLVNLTDVRLFAQLDDSGGIVLQPGGHGHFKAREQSELNVWLRVAAEGRDKNGHIIYSSMMKNRSDKRMFMFFHPSEDSPGTPFATRTLVDFAPLPKTP